MSSVHGSSVLTVTAAVFERDERSTYAMIAYMLKAWKILQTNNKEQCLGKQNILSYLITLNINKNLISIFNINNTQLKKKMLLHI